MYEPDRSDRRERKNAEAQGNEAIDLRRPGGIKMQR